MPRTHKVKDVDEQGRSETRWVDHAEGAASATIDLEIPTGAVNGVNTQFVFVGTPIMVMRNGVVYSPDAYSVAGTTVTITVPPVDGEITGLTTS